MRYSTHWHYLPAAIQDQARARWPSGKRAAGPGDWYLYEYELVEIAPGYQSGPVSTHDIRRMPRLVGRKAVKRTAPVGRCFGCR
jgi:hypothetical protein